MCLTDVLLCKSELQHLGKCSRCETVGTRRALTQWQRRIYKGATFRVNVIHHTAPVCLHSLCSLVHFLKWMLVSSPWIGKCAWKKMRVKDWGGKKTKEQQEMKLIQGYYLFHIQWGENRENFSCPLWIINSSSYGIWHGYTLTSHLYCLCVCACACLPVC